MFQNSKRLVPLINLQHTQDIATVTLSHPGEIKRMLESKASWTPKHCLRLRAVFKLEGPTTLDNFSSSRHHPWLLHWGDPQGFWLL